jgi:hypothetical protein
MVRNFHIDEGLPVVAGTFLLEENRAAGAEADADRWRRATAAAMTKAAIKCADAIDDAL